LLRDRWPPTQNLADVAEELGLSRERVRQLQRRAEDSLRAEMTANSHPAASE
jgi:DNA-directed RNA polymerase sigma subunit (sigma70/sigma32)